VAYRLARVHGRVQKTDRLTGAPPRSRLQNALRQLKEHEAALAYMRAAAPPK
jgi:hypothetical protein